MASFLTPEQRESLDAALLSKQTRPAEKQAALEKKKQPGAISTTKGPAVYDRHRPRHGRGVVRAKKGGGGKFAWGKSTDIDTGEEVDRNDPNYSSEDDEKVAFHPVRTVQLEAYKDAILAILEEYFTSGDLGEVVVALRELNQPEFDYYFVKKTISVALDKTDQKKELASVLLSGLYNEVINPAHIQKGFLAVVAGLDDFQVDVPNAVDIVALFLCRAVVDDVVAPSFLSRIPAVEGSVAARLKAACEQLLGSRHAGERLLRCWGSGAGAVHEETRAAIRTLLAEYASSHDGAEAARCLHLLAVPFFHHQLVKEALVLAIEDAAQAPWCLKLLKELAGTGEISESQMVKGFQRVEENLADIMLDTPLADQSFAELVASAIQEGWLDQQPESPPPPAVDGVAVEGHTVAAFKQSCKEIVAEYFSSGDTTEVAQSLQELGQPGINCLFIKIAVQAAMDHRNREREMVSALLPELHPAVLSDEQMAAGFTRLLDAVDDLQLDVPEAAHQVSLFLGRACVDEVLPPSYLTAVLPSLADGSAGVAVVQATGTLLGARHAAERLLNCWHGGDQTVGLVRDAMEELLKEFVNSKDRQEVSRSLLDLNVPYFHHELVALALNLAFDGGEKVAQELLKLLSELAKSGEISQNQMFEGFKKVEDRIDDLVLDFPVATEKFLIYKAQAKADGWLLE